jgi:hypothetical protein
MKKSIGWKEIVEALGVLALVASLVFVGYQLQQDRKLAATQVVVENNSATFDLFATMSDNRDIWHRGLQGKELSNEDQVAFKAIASAIYQRHLNKYMVQGLLDFKDQQDLVVQQYAFDLFLYPSLRYWFVQEGQLVNARNDFFDRPTSRGFRARVAEALEQLDEAAQEFPEKTGFPY